MTGPGNGIADADRERVIETLKVAFVQERLTMEELDVRVGGALGARSGAELAGRRADFLAELRHLVRRLDRIEDLAIRRYIRDAVGAMPAD